MRIHTSLKRIGQIIIVLVILFFLARNVYAHWLEVRTYEWNFNIVLLISSFTLLIVTFLFMVRIWQWKLLPLLGARIPFGKAFYIWFISSLGRYVPGKIWQVASMAYLTKKEGIPVETSITSAILAQVLAFIPGAALGAITLVIVFSYGIQWIALAFLIVVIGVILVYPPFLEKSINFIGKRLKRPPVRISGRHHNMLWIMFLYLLGWILYGSAFFLFARSVVTIPIIQMIMYPGIFTASYLVGLIAIFVPGGLGVREGILTALLSSFFPLSIATAIALASRLWFTLAEIICVLIAVRLRSK